MTVSATPYRHYYRERLELGQRFQDFVAHGLYRLGIPLICYQSREFQLKYGENQLGLEIKFDDLLKTTGNFWIETAEKTDPSNPHWVASGIERGDAWLYGIGNYEEFWIFGIRTLQEYRASHEPRLQKNKTETSLGFLLSRREGSPLAIKQIDWRLLPPDVPREPGTEG
jgi:hypothetical protein